MYDECAVVPLSRSTRPALSQLQSLNIRRSTYIMWLNNVDLHIDQLKSCERVGRVAAIYCCQASHVIRICKLRNPMVTTRGEQGGVLYHGRKMSSHILSCHWPSSMAREMTIHIARYVRQEYALNELINHLIFLDSTERRVSEWVVSWTSVSISRVIQQYAVLF